MKVNFKVRAAGLFVAVAMSFAVPAGAALAACPITPLGNGTIAKSYCAFVTGAYNYYGATENLTTWVATDPLFVIGNGQAEATRSNALTVLKNGNVGVGINAPAQKLEVGGNIYANGSLGVMLNGQDRPIITRGWDAFTSGNYLKAGRWGMFMEPTVLTIGTPAISSNGRVQFARYNANSTIASVSMFINDTGNVGIGTTSPAQKLHVAGNIKLTGNIVSDGDICIGKCV